MPIDWDLVPVQKFCRRCGRWNDGDRNLQWVVKPAQGKVCRTLGQCSELDMLDALNGGPLSVLRIDKLQQHS
jgi:hypothetical protein